MNRPWALREIASVIAVGLAYCAAGKLGLALASVNASATAVWPPTGIALAALLVLGIRVWPGILVGAFLVNLTTTGEVASSLAIAVGNTLEGLAGACLVTRWARGRHAFERAPDVFRFAVLAALLSTLISATIGVCALVLSEPASRTRVHEIWLTWWLGDAGGALVVAPLLILWHARPRWGWEPRRSLEAVLLLLSLAAVTLCLFSGLTFIGRQNYPVSFLGVPVVLWAAFRFGARETATVSFLLMAGAIAGTLRGYGPFVRSSVNDSLVVLAFFMGMLSVVGLPFAAMVAQLREEENQLRRTHDELDQRVQARTAELAEANQALLRIRDDLELRVRQRTVELERANATLRVSETRFRALIEKSSDVVVLLGRDGTVRYVSPAIERMLGYCDHELMGRSVAEFMHAEDRGPAQSLFARLIEQRGATMSAEYRLQHRNGSWRWIEDTSSNLLAEPGVAAVVCNYRDATDRHRADERVRQSLRDKEFLLKELHHRVKNNLQLVSSLLRLQSETIVDAQARASLRDCQSRIRAMTRIHETLYQSRDLAGIDFAHYLEGLTADLLSSFGIHPRDIAIEIEVAPVRFGLDVAIPCGLIVSELVANSLEHAFDRTKPNGNHRVRIALQPGPAKTCTLSVRDNGIGLPPDLDFRKTESLGLQLVTTLTEQLGGSIELHRNGGTEFSLRFATEGAVRT